MRFVVASAALAWVGLLVAAPILPAAGAAGLYGLGSLICHQIPERSFHLAGFQLPVCARCFGLYLGGAVGATVYLPTSSLRRWSLAAFSTARRARPVLALAFAPTLLTVGLEVVGLWGPSNMTRALAALPAGAAVALVVMNALGYTTLNARGRG